MKPAIEPFGLTELSCIIWLNVKHKFSKNYIGLPFFSPVFSGPNGWESFFLWRGFGLLQCIFPACVWNCFFPRKSDSRFTKKISISSGNQLVLNEIPENLVGYCGCELGSLIGKVLFGVVHPYIMSFAFGGWCAFPFSEFGFLGLDPASTLLALSFLFKVCHSNTNFSVCVSHIVPFAHRLFPTGRFLCLCAWILPHMLKENLFISEYFSYIAILMGWKVGNGR